MLRIENLRKAFGGVVATSDVSIHFPKESLSAVIGPNGAGKTTFFNLITGFDKPTSARSGAHWSFDGRKLDKTAASSVARAGMVRTFQITKALSRMPVIDNMLLAGPDQPGEKLFNNLFRRGASKARTACES